MYVIIIIIKVNKFYIKCQSKFLDNIILIQIDKFIIFIVEIFINIFIYLINSLLL